jgi:hypothetical protein
MHVLAAHIRGNAGIEWLKLLKDVFACIAAMQELVELFSPYGVVCQCRIFQKFEWSSCSSALVWMDCAASASRAIQALNDSFPRLREGDSQSMRLLLRFADSPEEKATKAKLSGKVSSNFETRCRYLQHTCIADEHAWYNNCLLSSDAAWVCKRCCATFCIDESSMTFFGNSCSVNNRYHQNSPKTRSSSRVNLLKIYFC